MDDIPKELLDNICTNSMSNATSNKHNCFELFYSKKSQGLINSSCCYCHGMQA